MNDIFAYNANLKATKTHLYYYGVVFQNGELKTVVQEEPFTDIKDAPVVKKRVLAQLENYLIIPSAVSQESERSDRFNDQLSESSNESLPNSFESIRETFFVRGYKIADVNLVVNGNGQPAYKPYIVRDSIDGYIIIPTHKLFYLKKEFNHEARKKAVYIIIDELYDNEIKYKDTKSKEKERVNKIIIDTINNSSVKNNVIALVLDAENLQTSTFLSQFPNLQVHVAEYNYITARKQELTIDPRLHLHTGKYSEVLTKLCEQGTTPNVYFADFTSSYNEERKEDLGQILDQNCNQDEIIVGLTFSARVGKGNGNGGHIENLKLAMKLISQAIGNRNWSILNAKGLLYRKIPTKVSTDDIISRYAPMFFILYHLSKKQDNKYYTQSIEDRSKIYKAASDFWEVDFRNLPDKTIMNPGYKSNSKSKIKSNKKQNKQNNKSDIETIDLTQSPIKETIDLTQETDTNVKKRKIEESDDSLDVIPKYKEKDGVWYKFENGNYNPTTQVPKKLVKLYKKQFGKWFKYNPETGTNDQLDRTQNPSEDDKDTFTES